MKLRNKITGEVVEWSFIILRNIHGMNGRVHYCSIDALEKEWEDYDETTK